MKKKALYKSIFKEISDSKGRFFSVFSLIALGVFALIGLKVSGPNMAATATQYFERYQLADVSMVSTYGLDESDQAIIESVEGVQTVELGYSLDVVLEKSEAVTRIFSRTDTLSQYELLAGKLPEKVGEIALDASLQEQGYRIGDTISFADVSMDAIREHFNSETFKIVGFVRSSEFIHLDDLGVSSIGTGQLDAFAVVTEESFEMDTYTIARLAFTDTAHLGSYDEAYQNKVDQHLINLESAFEGQPEYRLEQIKSQKLEAFSPAEEEVEAGDEALVNQEAAMKALESQLAALTLPVYWIQDRNSLPGYASFMEESQIVTALSNVFPVFLFAIAALVCLTTMTRMVEEKRTEIGTLKALGYDNCDIMKKFVVYGSVSSLSGVVVGNIIGHQLLPRVIFDAVSVGYIFESIELGFFFNYSLMALVIAMLCTTLATVISLRSTLKENAIALMRPKPPSNGSRILLERVPFIWKRLSFHYKVTARNTFRYKKRMVMTIFGVAGCTALLITGFGLRDSIGGIIVPQFDEIIGYDLVVVEDLEASEQTLTDYRQTLQLWQSEGEISDMGAVVLESVKVIPEEHDEQNVALMVPNSIEELSKFIKLRTRQGEKSLELSDHGIIITEKLARLTAVEVGGMIEIEVDGQSYEAEVAGITEMYMGHNIFISPLYYQTVFHEVPQYNASWIQLNDSSKENIEEIARKLMEQEATIAINQAHSNREMVQNIVSSLDGVVLVIILSASLLAIVVLYNLTTVNVSERIRELSTVKVLGFYPLEVTMYVFRETVLLTLLGIFAGFVGGCFLHGYILQSIEVIGNLMLSPELLGTNLFLSASLTIVFSFIVMAMMHRRLKRVDMIEALKSVE